MMYIGPNSIRLSLFLLCALSLSLAPSLSHSLIQSLSLSRTTLREPRLIPQLGNKMLERWATGLNSKEKISSGMAWDGKWKYDIFGYSVSARLGWCCVRGPGRGWQNTLYHCVWCFASVSAPSHGTWEKWIWLLPEPAQGKRDRERKLVRIFWRWCGLFSEAPKLMLLLRRMLF